MAYEQHYLWIYQTAGGLRCKLLDEDRFVDAQRAPGHHVCEVESPAQRITYNVAYPSEWEASQAHYLIDTQIKYWPLFNNGALVEWDDLAKAPYDPPLPPYNPKTG